MFIFFRIIVIKRLQQSFCFKMAAFVSPVSDHCKEQVSGGAKSFQLLPVFYFLLLSWRPASLHTGILGCEYALLKKKKHSSLCSTCLPEVFTSKCFPISLLNISLVNKSFKYACLILSWIHYKSAWIFTASVEYLTQCIYCIVYMISAVIWKHTMPF